MWIKKQRREKEANINDWGKAQEKTTVEKNNCREITAAIVAAARDSSRRPGYTFAPEHPCWFGALFTFKTLFLSSSREIKLF